MDPELIEDYIEQLLERIEVLEEEVKKLKEKK